MEVPEGGSKDWQSMELQRLIFSNHPFISTGTSNCTSKIRSPPLSSNEDPTGTKNLFEPLLGKGTTKRTTHLCDSIGYAPGDAKASYRHLCDRIGYAPL